MDHLKIFEILQIPLTRDERQIRAAYHRLLTGVNPEDDPEGFKQLRTAYESALEYARTPEEADGISSVEWLQNQEVGAFLKRLADIYDHFFRRLDAEEWKQLLADPILQSMDDGETAKWGMFSYLSEHFRLPVEIWKLLDGEFFIQENQQEMKEHLPENFVDYLIKKIESRDRDFPYEAFCGPPDADYDGFIQKYTIFSNEQFEDSPEGLEERGRRLQELAAYGITHPWYELDQAEYLAECGEEEQAKERIRALLKEHPEDEHVCLTGADFLAGRKEKSLACGVWKEYLTWEHQTRYGRYRALTGLAEMEAEEGRWEHAKELADEAGGIGNTDKLQQLRERIDRELIAVYTEKKEKLTEKEADTLCWCFVHAREYQTGIAFFDAHPEYDQDTFYWHKQMAILNMSAMRCEKALEETRQWRRCLEDFEGDEETLSWEQALCTHIEARIWNNQYFLEKKKDSPDPELLKESSEKSLACYDESLKAYPEHIDFIMQKTVLLRDMGEDRQVIDLCEQILRLNPSHFWACSYIQEAYDNLRMGQEVVDTFYRAKNIYAGNAEIYLRAVKVFLSSRQYQDALNIIRQAEEAGAVSHALLVKKFRALSRMAEKEDEKSWQTADACADEVIAQLTEEQADPKLLAEVWLERTYLYEKFPGPDKDQIKDRLLEYAEKSLELDDSCEIRYILGKIYIRYFQDHRHAFEHLKVCEERQETFEWVYFYLARCQEAFKEYDLALSYYRKVMELNPQFNDALWRMGWIYYRKKFGRTLQTEYAERAFDYLRQQEEQFGVFTDMFRWRASMFLRLSDYEKALSEVSSALNQEEDSGLWLLKGQALRKLDRHEEAVECFENSIRCKDRYGADDIFCYGRIFQCFLRQQKLQEGIAYFKEILKNTETERVRDFCLEHMADYAFIGGDHRQAFLWIKEWYGSLEFTEKGEDTWKRTAERIRDVLNVQLLHRISLDEEFCRKCQDASRLALQAAEDKSAPQEDRASMCYRVGELYFFMEDWDRACMFFNLAFGMFEDPSEYENYEELLEYLMKSCWGKNDQEGAKRYAELYREEQEKYCAECTDLKRSIEELMTAPGPDSKQKLYKRFCYAYYTRQYEKAREYAEKMDAQAMCWWCHEAGCTEAWEAKGLLAFLDGNLEEAVRAFQMSNRTSWLSGTKTACMMLRRLQQNASLPAGAAPV